jgi:tetratricopeptide (TPR) repeat protein
MNDRHRTALAALEDHRPGDAWAVARDLIAEQHDDVFALAAGAAALRLLGHRSRADMLQERANKAPLPPFPVADDLDFMRRLDELHSTSSSVARKYAAEGAHWLREKNFEKAEVCLIQALDLDPNCATAHYYRGLVAAEQGRTAVARLCFVNAMQADPDCMAARSALLAVVTKRRFNLAKIAAAL